jgi:hypothetical protein
MVIAVIAVCLGACREELVVGIIVTALAAPALVYTILVAARQTGAGNSMPVLDQIGTFLKALAPVAIIEFASLISFVTTCIPTGFISIAAGQAGVIFAFIVGGAAGIATAVYMTRYLLRKWGRRA